jgi:hypothetical protein
MRGSSAERWIVTTPRRRHDLNRKARETAARLGLEFIARGVEPFDRIFERAGADAAYVETDKFPLIHTAAGEIYFHINTAGRRTSHGGEPDALIRALAPRPEDSVLDATLGIGCDALVIATQLTSGKLTGVESNPLLADLVSRGLCDYHFKKDYLREAAGRIEVVRSDHLEFLKGRADDEFDLIYFDPMFEETVAASPTMQRIKALAEKTPLTEAAVVEARRVARRRIVIKGRRGRFLPIDFPETIPSGKTIFYGIIDV